MANDHELVETLLRACRKSERPPIDTAITQEVREAFLRRGSRTPDNMNCVEHIEYGTVEGREFGPPKVSGLKVKESDVLISDVMHLVEDADIPDIVKKYYIDITVDEWSAITRMTTMILLSLECNEWK